MPLANGWHGLPWSNGSGRLPCGQVAVAMLMTPGCQFSVSPVRDPNHSPSDASLFEHLTLPEFQHENRPDPGAAVPKPLVVCDQCGYALLGEICPDPRVGLQE